MEYREQPVRIMDLVKSVMLAWRKILLFALIGMLLLSAFGFYRIKSTSPTERRTSRVTLTDKQIEVATLAAQSSSSEAVRLSRRIKSLTLRAESIGDQLANSLFLRIDPEAQRMASFDVTFQVQESSEESQYITLQNRHQLLRDYIEVANSDDFFKTLELKGNGRVSAVWLRELIRYETNQGDILHVQVTAHDDKTIQDLSRYVRDFFQYEMKGKIQSIVPHTVIQSDLQWDTVKNPDIPLIREKLQNELDDIFVELNENREALDAIVAAYLDDTIASMEEVYEPSPAVRISSYILKFAILGLFLGALVQVAWVIFKVTSSPVLRYPDDFSYEQNLLLIGRIASREKRAEKRFLPGIDRFIRRLFNRQQKETSAAHLAVIINGLRQDDRPIAIIAEQTEGSIGLVKSLQNASLADLKAEEGVKALKDSHYAILVVRPGETKGKDAVRDLEIATHMGKAILGIISEECLHET